MVISSGKRDDPMGVSMTSRETDAAPGSIIEQLYAEREAWDNAFLHDWIEAANRPRVKHHHADMSMLYAWSLVETARRALELINRRLHGQHAIWH